MNSNLKTAILEFLANEFKLDPKAVGDDLNFTTDLGLDPDSLADLLGRLQESLDFSLPDDKISTITTIEDLLQSIDEPETP